MSDGPNGGQEPVVQQHGAPVVPQQTAAGTQWVPPTPGTAVGSVVLPVASVPKRPRNTRVVGAGIGAVAVLVAGAFAVRAVTAEAGGAESPEAAAQAFFDAIADEDVVGAMDAVLPGEQAAFRDPLVDLVAELRRLEVADEAADASAVAGIDIEFPELEFTERPTNVEDITNVEVDGVATIVVDGEELPLGDLLLDLLGDTDTGERFEGEDPIEDYAFTTVRHDGGWYVSLAYSVAERVRWGDGDPGDGPDIPLVEAGVQAEGGETPEEGMDLMLDAIEDLDLEGMIATLDPNEFAPLQRYAPLFLDEAQSELDAAGDVEISIDDREYTVETDGDRARMTLSAATVSLAADGLEYELEWDGECIRVSGSDIETEEVCLDDAPEQSGTDVLEDFGFPTEELTALGETVAEAFADVEDAGIAMTRVDGEWFVSPIGTMTDTMLSLVRALDRDEIEDIRDAGAAVADAVAESFGGGFGVPGIDDGGFDDGGFDDGSGTGMDLYFECVNLTDAEERASCLRDGIDAGQIESYLVETEILYPECGLADYFSFGFSDYSDLSDEEFVALLADARECFEGLESSGQITADEFPISLADVACYEGRNPDAVEDIDEAMDLQGRIFDCLMAAD